MNSDNLTSVTESDQQQNVSKKHTPIATPVGSPSATSTLSSASSSSSSSSSPLDSPVKGSKKHPISLFPADEDSLQQHNVDSLDHPELLIDVPSSTSDPTVMISEASPNQSPPIQVMEREEVPPDPYRIPSTVFARSPSATPVEWSVQSNESLFSIHMGNNSFSADQIFLMGRSGELGMPGDYNNFLDLKKDPSSNPNSPSPASTPGNKVGESLNAEDAAASATMNEVSRVSEDDQNTEKTPPVDSARHSSSISYRSDESGASVVSFAFPILTSAEGGRAPSTKVETEHPLHQVKEKSNEQQEEQEQGSQQPQPNTPTTPNATGANDRKWFSCFSCCSFCS
ncbi:hypothetical protein C5167_005794 [Papaver somniferum]|uniref:Uncharacterized protein n=1 Tax=Papaver somniferum TaxID=3469 RepID=A0A4Y7JEZ5_PAPSO|nr:probable serine/threonine-protein kinase DDB_G0278665 [Papaver somniferum]RZC58491.1 hypothetical protein C5167_005794 [Papaver somniferum]